MPATPMDGEPVPTMATGTCEAEYMTLSLAVKLGEFTPDVTCGTMIRPIGDPKFDQPKFLFKKASFMTEFTVTHYNVHN